MNENLNLILPIITIVLLLLVLSVTVFRIPITSTKVSFGFFCFFFLLWNLTEFLQVFHFFENQTYELLSIFFSCSTFYTLLVSGLHFPFFRRREVFINVFTTFVGGMGTFLFLLVFSIPFINQSFPLESKFYLYINYFLVKSYSIFCFLAFIGIAIYKITLSSERFKKYYSRTASYIILFVFFIYILNYFTSLDVQNLKKLINIIYFDAIFLILLIFSLIQFKFISFYPGLFSIFVYQEIPKLIIQREAPSSLKGAKFLKEELWKIYESENWKASINEFWFSIIIDETLDNAVEHGGRRWEDMITIQVFVTTKFIDFYIIDSGKGFDPTKIPDPRETTRKSEPTGRGIHIMKQLFEVSWNFLGNEIKIRVSKDPKKNPSES